MRNKTLTSWITMVFMVGLMCVSAQAAGTYSQLVQADDPVAYWQLNQAGTGATAVNVANGPSSAGAAANGTFTSGVGMGTAGLLRGSTDTAITVSNGTVDRMATAGFEKFAGGSGFSVEYWTRMPTTMSGFQPVVGDGEVGGDFNLMSYRIPGGGIRSHVQTNTGISAIDTSGQPWTETLNTIHHVVSTWDATTGLLQAYVDGRLQSVNVTRTGTPVNTNNPIFIGQDNRETPNKGTLVVDDAAVYNKPLSESQVRAHFNRGNFGNLIDQFDYTDTFTDTVFGGIPGRATGGAFPVNSPGINVEDNYGNTPRAWRNDGWSLNRDAVIANGALVYPGSNLRGSVSGITQTGGGGLDYGIEYGPAGNPLDARRNYVVQFDAVQTADRIDITTGSARDTIFSANGLSVFFRVAGQTPSDIGVYNVSLGETYTGLSAPMINAVGQWHNYAVRFDLADGLLDVFVDQVMIGRVNLADVGSTHRDYLSVINATTNDAVSVGYAGGDRLWSDNFAVGSFNEVPEPATLMMLTLAAGAVGRYVRRRK